jgi:hypothetical protein
MPPQSVQPQTPQSSSYFDYAPSTPRPMLHQTSSGESTPIHHPHNPNAMRKSTSSDANTPYQHVTNMDESSAYYQQQSPYGNQNQIKPQMPPQPQQLLPRGMVPRPGTIMPRYASQESQNFVRTPTAPGTPSQPTRFIFTSPSHQPLQQATHYVQYASGAPGQHTVVVQQGTVEGFQRMVRPFSRDTHRYWITPFSARESRTSAHATASASSSAIATV